MGLLDTMKQVMKGRSEMVERGIDTAVERLGRFSSTLEQRAQTVKEKARSLDPERDGGEAAGSTTPSTPPSPLSEHPPAAAEAGPVVTGGSSLKGDLVPDADPPPAEGSLRPDPGPGATPGGTPA